MQDDAVEKRKNLSILPLSELVKAQNELGLKKTQEILLFKNNTNVDTIADHLMHENTQNQTTKYHKKVLIPKKIKQEEPLEISAKIRPKLNHNIMNVKKTIKIDPRFGERFGEFNEEKFSKAYGFIEELRQNELNAVKKKLKKIKNSEQKEKLKQYQKSALNRMAAHKDKQHKKEVEKIIKLKEKEITEKSNKPFHFKKSVKKQFQLAYKFSQLKKQNKIDKYLLKKKVKTGKKESKLPFDNIAI